MKIGPLQLLIVWLCGPSGSYAQGTTQINFDGPPTIPANADYTVTNYIESGILFRPMPTSRSFGRVGAASGTVYPRTLFPDDGSAYLDTLLGESLVFSLTNGSLFGLVAVDLAEYSTVVPNAVTVQFVGYRPDGSTVSESFTTDGIIDGTGPLADFQTFQFGPAFTDLDRVEIPTYGWSLDNLVVSRVVPEPSAGLLVLVGGMVVGWGSERRFSRRFVQLC